MPLIFFALLFMGTSIWQTSVAVTVPVCFNRRFMVLSLRTRSSRCQAGMMGWGGDQEKPEPKLEPSMCLRDKLDNHGILLWLFFKPFIHCLLITCQAQYYELYVHRFMPVHRNCYCPQWGMQELKLRGYSEVANLDLTPGFSISKAPLFVCFCFIS